MTGLSTRLGERRMRIGVLSYPMLYQRVGGLQVQISETIQALKALGVDAELVDPNVQPLSDFDVIHIFSAANGNHRMAETARSLGCKVVLSPLVRPTWTRWTGLREAFVERMVGRLTNWHIQSTYAHIKSALDHADKIVALGTIERDSITAAFRIPAERVAVIENGVVQRFFDATPDEFRARYGISGKFVLNVAAISPHKNQLAIVKALQGQDVQLVLIGGCLSECQPYLDVLTAAPNVRYLGKLPYEETLLSSAYAAATVFALPSDSEVMPLSVMEALAAGTPAVMTERHSMRLDAAPEVVKEHAPSDIAALRSHLLQTLEHPPSPGLCRQAVAGLRWSSVAERLLGVYEEVLMETDTRQRTAR